MNREREREKGNTHFRLTNQPKPVKRNQVEKWYLYIYMQRYVIIKQNRAHWAGCLWVCVCAGEKNNSITMIVHRSQQDSHVFIVDGRVVTFLNYDLRITNAYEILLCIRLKDTLANTQATGIHRNPLVKWNDWAIQMHRSEKTRKTQDANEHNPWINGYISAFLFSFFLFLWECLICKHILPYSSVDALINFWYFVAEVYAIHISFSQLHIYESETPQWPIKYSEMVSLVLSLDIFHSKSYFLTFHLSQWCLGGSSDCCARSLLIVHISRVSV